MSGHECPTCGKFLSTLRGMRQHHAKFHDEYLPNRTCEECGTRFHDSKAQRTYCDDCYTEAGEHNGNWTGAKEAAVCRVCGDSFEYYPSDKDGVFCPDCVEESDEFLGTPSWELRNVGRVEFTCEQCHQAFEVLESAVERLEQRGRFCSHGCRSKWMSENWRGENHHQWKDGRTEYAGNWWEVRSLTLDRDERTCQSCGTTTEELERGLHVHHIEPVRTFDDPNEAHYLENLVTLCPTCHPKVESGKLPLPELQ